ncbi:azurin [Bergeyella cardium]|uniref:Azurin n=1 Tax=Bergeyella cardium TaxID=1585976 RepID=A0A6P1QXU6_9FLAO|nr:azurin [Bergeyella cardium]QHN65540.1 azurin [Bergeyella cardium]WHE33123.1 azurin [Bergeyella cardium]WHF59773.1 azurin [Bergeyella cardium]
MKKSIQLLGVLFLSAALVACGGEKKDSTEETAPATEEAAPATEDASADAAATPETSNTLLLESTDDMKFLQTEFKVKAGEEVTLTLKHTGKQPKEVMGHNFVLLKPGVDIPAFAEKAMKAKDTDYIPDGDADIIAHTKTIGGGEEDTVKFTLEPGTYEFLCSFPGHYSMMKGKIVAE